MNKSQYYIPKDKENKSRCGPHFVLELCVFVG